MIEKQLENWIISYPKTKSDQAQVSAILKNAILGGNFDPLKAFIALKSYVNVIETAMKHVHVQGAVLDEISKYEKDQRVFGVRVGKGATGNTYDFSSSAEYVDLSDEIAKKSDELKKIKSALVASYHASIKIASMEDGAELKIKMTEAGRETIKITFSEK